MGHRQRLSTGPPVPFGTGFASYRPLKLQDVSTTWWRFGLAAALAVGFLVATATSMAGLTAYDLVPGVVAVAAVIAALLWWPPRIWPPALAAVVSIATTVVYASPERDNAPGWLLIEPAALLLLVFLATRWGRPWTAAPAGLAVALVVLRFLPPSSLIEALASVALWGMPAVAVGAAAGWLRWNAAERQRAVADARREQRLRLARDLHDFVAHDVSEMVAQAQAARFLNEGAADAFERIEAAGLRALGSIDQTVHALHWDSDRTPVPGLDDLADLAERFTAAGAARVRLDMSPDIAVPRDVGSTVYRVVTEALTNIRRHAPDAREVLVSVVRSGADVRLTVTNDGELTTEAGRRGGLGLSGLAERVEVLGGTLTAGPAEPGWRLSAQLPVVSK
jgi:signal transduction histidine kinase